MKKMFELAYKEAIKAYKKNEIPVGAIIVKNNKIIAKTHNDRQKKKKVFGHAEINCILKTARKIKDWRLDECIMYVTLEPCEMCKMFIKESRIKKVYYLISNQKNNNSHNQMFAKTNDCVLIEEKYKKLLESFFLKLR